MQAQDHCGNRWLILLSLTAFVLLALNSASTLAQPSDNAEAPFSQTKVDQLLASAKQSGNFDRGLKVYGQAKSACFSCHKVGSVGGAIGPELSAILKQRTESQIAESLLWPNRTIAPEFQPYKILTFDGVQISGYRSEPESSPEVLAIIDPPTKALTKIPRSEIESEAKGLSLMPIGLVDSLSAQDQADLLAFLLSLRSPDKLDLQSLEASIRTASTHEPAKFPWVPGPLNPELRPAFKEHVNRNRMYDFYSKQAAYFVKEKPELDWLEEFPGLDGPDFGHWGNQNEASWEGSEWNDAIPELVQCNVFISDAPPVARAVCFRLGDQRSWSACFDPDTLSYVRLWSGGFVKFSHVRHGFIDGVRVVGTESPLPHEAQPIRNVVKELQDAKIQYRGYYIHQDQILFCYEANGVQYLDAPTIVDGKFQRIVAPRDEHPMRELTKGHVNPSPVTIETAITLGTGKGLVVDTIALPTKNPWNQIISCGDHAFLRDGSAIVVTMQGDVWRAEGVAYVPASSGKAPSANKTAKWQRIGHGLHHALGVWVDQDQIYVLGRNQITRLHDFNGDREIDYYECFSNAFETSPSGHDYICGLQRDVAGNFYTASGNQGILQITPDGSKALVIATGFRNPDGLGLMPDGTITVPSSEGDWTPTSMISQILPIPTASKEPPRYEQNPPPFYGYRGPKKDQKITLPLVYLPRGVDNSSGGQVWVDDERMGPLTNSIVHTSFGAATASLILQDKVGDQFQGAVVPLPGEYRAGIHRAHLNPADGQLYFTGMNGWGSYAPEPGCFQRLRYTGNPVQMPKGFHVHRNGVAIKFHQSIDPVFGKNAKLQFAQCWNYRYSPGYGSKEYSVLHAPMVGHDRLAVTSSYVLDGGNTLLLEIPELQRCNQLHLRLQVGEKEVHELFATVHDLAEDRTDLPNYAPSKNKQLLPHPMQRDLEYLERNIPNPYLKKIENARQLVIESRDNLQFSTKLLQVTAGENIKLTFKNPDVVPHNWALIRPGTLEKIGALTNKLVNDPDAFLRHYVPQSDEVICYTDIVEPKGEFSIYFVAPTEPGRYPYLCTFPGHWMVMNGELIVHPAQP